jgi:transcriptional regulator of acetoin/glycerol metabolism
VIERAVILCDGDTLVVEEDWLMPESSMEVLSPIPITTVLNKSEKDMIESALVSSRGLVSGPRDAAAQLGIPRTTLEARIASLGINKYRFKARA